MVKIEGKVQTVYTYSTLKKGSDGLFEPTTRTQKIDLILKDDGKQISAYSIQVPQALDSPLAPLRSLDPKIRQDVEKAGDEMRYVKTKMVYVTTCKTTVSTTVPPFKQQYTNADSAYRAEDIARDTVRYTKMTREFYNGKLAKL